jgi:hypothetical protein
LAGALALAACTSSDTNPSSSMFNPGGTTGSGTLPTGETVLIRLGTDNLVESLPPLYKKVYVAVVTDTNGRAVSGATVIFALRPGMTLNPGGYAKGFYVLPPPPPATPQQWTQVVTANCANEDANFNQVLDPGEDLNGNGLLEPPGVSDVNPIGITDASGIATATITYPKNYASWTQVTLEASTAGTVITPATSTFVLVGLASDYSDLNVAPPGDRSPFGTSGNCADTL